MKISESTNQIRNLIESLGGTYIEVQTSFGDGDDFIDEDRVIFTRVNSPTLLSLPVSDCTQSAIQEKLGRKVTKFHLVEFRTKMRDLADQLHNLANQIEEELKNVD